MKSIWILPFTTVIFLKRYIVFHDQDIMLEINKELRKSKLPWFLGLFCSLPLHKLLSQLQIVTSAPPSSRELQRFNAWPLPHIKVKTEKNKMKSCKMFLKDFVFQPTCDILESSVRSDATFHSTRTSCDVFWVGRVKFIAAFLSAFATCVTFEWFFSYWKRKC